MNPGPAISARSDSGAREVESLDDRLREVARLSAERLGEHHREIRRPIAERRIARTLDDRLDVVRRAERLRGASELRAQEFGAVHYLSELRAR